MIYRVFGRKTGMETTNRGEIYMYLYHELIGQTVL